MKVTNTEEAVADLVEAITYLNERNSTAAAKLDADTGRGTPQLSAERGGDGSKTNGEAPDEGDIAALVEGVRRPYVTVCG